MAKKDMADAVFHELVEQTRQAALQYRKALKEKDWQGIGNAGRTYTFMFERLMKEINISRTKAMELLNLDGDKDAENPS